MPRRALLIALLQLVGAASLEAAPATQWAAGHRRRGNAQAAATPPRRRRDAAATPPRERDPQPRTGRRGNRTPYAATGRGPVDRGAGYNNANCEAHPHAGQELDGGGWLMVGDSVCWDGSASYDRAVFVVVAEADGAERWSRTLGDLGFNYGKFGSQLGDGTLLIAGVKSVVDDAVKKDYAYARPG